MALNTKNREVDRLVTEIVSLTGESKTEAIRRALQERKVRLAFQSTACDRGRRLREFLSEVWASVPPEQLGRRLSHEEEEAILGFGPEGV